MGAFAGEDEYEALDVYSRAAGYMDHADLLEQHPDAPDDWPALVVELVDTPQHPDAPDTPQRVVTSVAGPLRTWLGAEVAAQGRPRSAVIRGILEDARLDRRTASRPQLDLEAEIKIAQLTLAIAGAERDAACRALVAAEAERDAACRALVAAEAERDAARQALVLRDSLRELNFSR